MPFFMNEERQMVQDLARQFAEKELAPIVEKIDVEDIFPEEQFRKLGELGLLGFGIPEEDGGNGLDTTAMCLVAEEFSKVLPAFAQILMSHSGICVHYLPHLVDDKMREKYLRGACDGTYIGVSCITEPCGNSDMTGQRSRAVRDGDDWIINGEKIFCTNVGAADFYIAVVITTDLDLAHAKGWTAFLVPKGTPGVTVTHIEDKIGWRGSSTGSILFEDVRVPDSWRIGPADYYFTLDGTPELIAEGACALGIAEAAYEAVKDYAKQRRLPNGIPFYYAHGTMRTRITEMRMKIEAMRGMVYMIADKFDKGENVVPEFLLVKPYTASCSQDICSVAIDLLGGNGVCRDMKIEKWWREAKVCMIGGGQYDILLDQAGMQY